MKKDTAYFRAKLTALRSAVDDLLSEMEEQTPSAPRQRQNKKDVRVLNFKAFYQQQRKKPTR